MKLLQKLIITNRRALTKKYKSTGMADITRALARLKVADALRGIETHVEFVDAPIKKHIPKVTKASDEPASKKAIDALFAAYASPDYLLILGAGDVIPHQRLVNPLRGPDDTDVNVPSDLPYACDAPYSKKIEDFLGPTRVVGRLPDVRGAKDADDLIDVIDWSARFDGTADRKRFVLSAQKWRGATIANIKKGFGSAGTINYSPKAGPKWPPASLRPSLHFINCHGATSDPTFYGEPAAFEAYPEALFANGLNGSVTRGAVIAAECCFGGQLYEPDSPEAKGIANTYLLHGAAAVCGSTNVAYGASTAKDRCSADVLCTQFMAAVIGKATTGRALLQARQELVAATSPAPLDPMDLKTLAQFLLLGDPCLRPFGVPTGGVEVVGIKKSIVQMAAKTTAGPTPKALSADVHAARRKQLKASGDELGRTTPAAGQKSGSVSPSLRGLMEQLISKEGLTPGHTMQFTTTLPSGGQPKAHAKGGPKGARATAKAGPGAANGHDEQIQVIFAKEMTVKKAGGGMLAGLPESGGDGGVAVAEAMQVVDSPSAAPTVKSVGAVVCRTRGAKVVSYKLVWSK